MLLFGAVLHLAVVPLAHKIQALERALSQGEQNVYEIPWLDSVRTELGGNINKMQAFKKEINRRFVDFHSLQSMTDSIRTLFTESGLSVIRINPSESDSGRLRLITIRVDGITDFTELNVLLTRLSKQYPQYSIERMHIRKSRQGLNFSIYLSACSLRRQD